MRLEVALATVFLAAVLVFFGVPFLWLALSSLDPQASPRLQLPEEPTLSKYREALLEETAVGVRPVRWILNSLAVAAATATLTTAVATLAAYSLTRHRFRGQGALVTAMVAFRLIPSIIIAVPVTVILRELGMLNSLVAFTIVMTALILPFAIMMLESQFAAIPPVYEEAAMVDGLTRVGAFFRVTLRLGLPGIAAAWLLAFVIVWSEFVIPLFIIADPEKQPAAVGLFYASFGEYGRVDYARLSAFSIIYSIPAVLVFAAARRHLARGMATLVTR